MRTFKRLRQLFYWPAMYSSVQAYVSACEICQRNKTETLSPAGLLQPLSVPCQVWEDISLDFIEGLPTSQGKDTILVVVDRLSKYAHFIPLSHPFTAKAVAEKFVDGVVKLHGMPRSIISDRDPIFISKFWQEFFKLSGTQLNMSSSYHPQTDGQTEVVNRCLEQYLRCFANDQPRKWLTYLAWAEFWYNTAYHASIGMTPFQALYGRLPPSIPTYEKTQSIVHEVDQQLANRDELLARLKKNLESARNRMKQLADKKRREVIFQEGDLVYLRLHPYRQQTVSSRKHQKLSSRFYGPYAVEKRIGEVAYKLKLPVGARIHPTFHVSLLRKHIGNNAQVHPELPPLTDDGEVVLEPEAILETRWIKRGKTFAEEQLVKWKRLPLEEATWESAEWIKFQFPTVDLEDKDPLQGGGIDKIRRSDRVLKPNPKYLG